MKFIIVDDNRTFREGIKYYIENILGHDVINMADDGANFLTLESMNEADVILMDIEMPRLNGIETVKKALWINDSLKFIAVTSYSDKAYLDELISAGFKACVFKSKIYDELVNAIDMVMNHKLSFPNDINIIKE